MQNDKKKHRLPAESNEEFGSNPFELDSGGLDSIPSELKGAGKPKVEVSLSRDWEGESVWKLGEEKVVVEGKPLPQLRFSDIFAG